MKRHLPVAAFLALAVAIGFALYQLEEAEDQRSRISSQARQELAAGGRQAIIVSCLRNNELRLILQKTLVRTADRTTNAAVAEILRQDAAQLDPVDCAEMANAIPRRIEESGR